MKDLSKTELEDRREQSWKIAMEVKGNERSKATAKTAREQEVIQPRFVECALAIFKFSIMDLEGNMEENEARLGRAWAEKRRADFGRMRQIYAERQESLRIREAQLEGAVQEKQEVLDFYDSQSSSQQEANLDVLIADMSSRSARMVEDDFARGEREMETGDDRRLEEGEAEMGNNSCVEEKDARTEKEIHLKALFAQTDKVIARNKSLGTYVEFKAQHDAFMKKQDEGRLRDCPSVFVR